MINHATRAIAIVGALVLSPTIAFGQITKLPPSDDSSRSSVRLLTSWVTHELTYESCMQHARRAIEKTGYFVEATNQSIYGLREGLTTVIRCDLEKIALFGVAFRIRPPSAQEQNRYLEELMQSFNNDQ